MAFNNSFIICKPKSCTCSSEGHDSSCTCPLTELVRNGGFEELFLFGPVGEEARFVGWTFEEDDGMGFFVGTLAYEGIQNITFFTQPSEAVRTKAARIFQNVPVTPGCLLQLSFAEFLNTTGRNFDDLDVSARVYYGDASFESPNQTDLIRIDIDYDNGQEELGYNYHQKVASVPVPFNITSVTVEFFVVARDAAIADNATEWLLDGVSLRSVSQIRSF